MTSELVVDVQPKEVSIALLEDKQLVELQSEGRNISFSVGNMYLGRVKKLMPGLNACFVDVGYEKDAFLHYLDLGPQFNSLEKYVKQTLSDKKKLNPITKATILPDLEKDGTVSNTLKVGQEVVVQIVKEPISTKGPRLTSELSFAGRYLVLIPFNDKVSVSQKIKSSEERARLKQLLMSIKPKNFGVIVRTVAEGKRVAELDGELKVLLKHWEDAITKVQKATKFPTLIYEETSRAVGLLRDLFNPSFENIHVNNEAVYHEIKDYVTLIALLHITNLSHIYHKLVHTDSAKDRSLLSMYQNPAFIGKLPGIAVCIAHRNSCHTKLPVSHISTAVADRCSGRNVLHISHMTLKFHNRLKLYNVSLHLRRRINSINCDSGADNIQICFRHTYDARTVRTMM